MTVSRIEQLLHGNAGVHERKATAAQKRSQEARSVRDEVNAVRADLTVTRAELTAQVVAKRAAARAEARAGWLSRHEAGEAIGTLAAENSVSPQQMGRSVAQARSEREAAKD